VVTVLIVIGVLAFLLVDAYILLRVFRGRASADELGSLPVPGEVTVTLSAGKVKLSYQESYKASGAEDHIDFGVPSALEVTVTSLSGEELEIKGPGFGGMGAALDTGSNWSRARIGTVEVAEPGPYTITAHGELQDPVEPRVLVGR
jgi:hypothetical protein